MRACQYKEDTRETYKTKKEEAEEKKREEDNLWEGLLHEYYYFSFFFDCHMKEFLSISFPFALSLSLLLSVNCIEDNMIVKQQSLREGNDL